MKLFDTIGNILDTVDVLAAGTADIIGITVNGTKQVAHIYNDIATTGRIASSAMVQEQFDDAHLDAAIANAILNGEVIDTTAVLELPVTTGESK